jgi:pimeloyl-ACP methyl ester carboxylesterase
MREDLRAFYAERGLSRASLLGHSMGGKTAMEFALAYPDMVENLVIVDIAPRAYPPQHDDVLKALGAVDLARCRSRREVEEALGEYIQSIPVRMFLMKNLKRAEDGRFSWKMNLAVIQANYDEVNRAVTGSRVFPHPALFIRAQSAQYISDEDAEGIRALFPKARIATIDAGHWVHAESPQPFFRMVRQFLDA